MILAKARAMQSRQIAAAREKESVEAAKFEREIRRRHLEIEASLTIRLWWTQLIAILGGLIGIGALIATAWHYADSGNIGAGLAVFGLGSALTAGVFGTQIAITRKLQEIVRSVSDDTARKRRPIDTLLDPNASGGPHGEPKEPEPLK